MLFYHNPKHKIESKVSNGYSQFRIFFVLFLRFDLLEREAETQAEGETGSMQGARCGTPSPDPGSYPEPKADA